MLFLLYYFFFKNICGEKSFQESLYRDEKKLILCKSNGVKMLYYDSEHNHKYFLTEKVYNNKEEIIKKNFTKLWVKKLKC